MPWVSYDSFSVECPDGYLYFPPIVNWGKYYLENNRIMMPVTCGLNHAIADGYLMSNIFVTLAKEIETFTK
jgi:chloramphenicol O-acetyltransferase